MVLSGRPPTQLVTVVRYDKTIGIGYAKVRQGGGTLGSDRPLQLVGVKITKSCRNMLEVAGQTSQTHYRSNSGEILPHFYVNNTFLAQKLTKLEHFKEIAENFIEKSLKIQKFDLQMFIGHSFRHFAM